MYHIYHPTYPIKFSHPLIAQTFRFLRCVFIKLACQWDPNGVKLAVASFDVAWMNLNSSVEKGPKRRVGWIQKHICFYIFYLYSLYFIWIFCNFTLHLSLRRYDRNQALFSTSQEGHRTRSSWWHVIRRCGMVWVKSTIGSQKLDR